MRFTARSSVRRHMKRIHHVTSDSDVSRDAEVSSEEDEDEE